MKTQWIHYETEIEDCIELMNWEAKFTMYVLFYLKKEEEAETVSDYLTNLLSQSKLTNFNKSAVMINTIALYN